MRTETFLRHLALIAVVALLAYPAGAGPGNLGLCDEVASIRPVGDCDRDGGQDKDKPAADEGRAADDNKGGGFAPSEEGTRDDRDKRDTKRGKACVRDDVRLGAAVVCRSRTRARVAKFDRLAGTRSLALNVLRRR